MKKSLALFTVALVSVGSAFAQPTPPPPPNVAIPLDVVVSLLVIAGIVYGAYKLSKRTDSTALAE